MRSRERLRAVLASLEHRIGTRRGALGLFCVALVVYGLRSVAVPVIPGRDFGTYLRFYVQIAEWDSVLPMTMLFRTPLAPLVVGGTLDLVGGWGLQAVMAILYASSIVAWSRVGLVFGSRTSLVAAAALVLYPGYGMLFHAPASEPVVATAFAAWALALARAWLDPTPGRFALLGVAVAAAALTRPGYQVLALSALVPLALAVPWRTRLASATACLGVVVVLLGAWVVNNGLRYDDYALARGGSAFFPFYRAFTTDRIVAPENGDASRRLAEVVEVELLPEEPYRSYGITLERFFGNGGPREFEDVVGVTDRVWGWDTDYAQMRAVSVEAVRAHPWRYARGVAETIFDELWSPLHIALPADEAPAPGDGGPPGAGGAAGLPLPSEGEQIPAARQGFFTTTPDASVTEEWTSATDHALVFADPEAGRRWAEVEARSAQLFDLVPPHPGSTWLTLQYSRSSKLYPPPLLWLVVGLAAWAWRRPAYGALAAALVGSALLLVFFQALAVYSIIEFAIPVAPALIVFGAAGLVGNRPGRSDATR